jgi:hypothetical protein
MPETITATRIVSGPKYSVRPGNQYQVRTEEDGGKLLVELQKPTDLRCMKCDRIQSERKRATRKAKLLDSKIMQLEREWLQARGEEAEEIEAKIEALRERHAKVDPENPESEYYYSKKLAELVGAMTDQDLAGKEGLNLTVLHRVERDFFMLVNWSSD